MGNHRAEPHGSRRASSETHEAPSTYVGRRVARPAAQNQIAEPVPAGTTMTVAAVAPRTSPGAGRAHQELLTPSRGTRLSATESAPTRQLDTGEINRVIADLEPVDQTTSFAEDNTESMPLVPAERPRTQPGRRKASRRSTARTGLKSRASLPALVGIAAMAVAATGASGFVGIDNADHDNAPTARIGQANALSGSSGESRSNLLDSRGDTVSRDSRRDALSATSDKELSEAAEAVAAERAGELKKLASQAQSQADKIEENKWVLPLSGYRLTATYGQYGLWATYHTGLDFAAPNGTQIYAVANGTVTDTGYEGAYGNRTVITLDDGTEIWFCHQTTIDVAVGETVRAGQPIGTVGSTGNVTGPHLHLEVRPGAGDPVDPFEALSVNGARP